MKKARPFPWAISDRRISDFLPVVIFLVIVLVLFSVNAFPALYGDEYGSINEAQHLAQNIHAIGYLFQLHFWSSIFRSDWWLRILSILWLGAGLFWLNQWLKKEQMLDQTRALIVWLALLNPFLWMYGFQVRFYAMFFATSILFIGCFRAWQKLSSGRNLTFLILSAILLITSHLFGVLVIATVLLYDLWTTLGSKRWILAFLLIFVVLVVFLPFTRTILVDIVYRLSNPYASAPVEAAARGVSLGMLAKVPLTFYFFMLGERVYPLWWWIVLPAMLVMGTAFFLGLWQLRCLPGLSTLAVLMLLNIPLMFLVLDPLAPPALQGAAPRYVIFVLPYFIILLALGTQAWKPIKPALILVSLVGLYCLARPIWSYGGSDFTDWPRYLKDAVVEPRQSCIVTDGRAEDAINRYAPPGVKIVHDNAQECLGFPRIVLVSDDFRLSMVRSFDEMANAISKDYSLVSNVTLFPAQITVYEKTTPKRSQLVPGRLDLPEQDLHFPILIPEHGWQMDGFMRLDDKTPTITLPVSVDNSNQVWILTNYRVENKPDPGTPVFTLHFNPASGGKDTEITLHASEETAGWQGSCNSCASIYEWTKLLHLLGGYSYSGAYSQYQAHVWGSTIKLLDLKKYTSVTITFLLPNGTGYFWGIIPETN